MYLLQADETNTEPNQGDFFIYGGLVLPMNRMLDVHQAVEAIREKYDFSPDDQFKFHTRSRPEGMDFDVWTAAKAEALTVAASLDVKLIVYVIHHGIAGGVDPEKRNRYALNALIAHYDLKFLAAQASVGAVTLDRLEEKFGYAYLRSRFQSPLDLPDGRSPALNRVLHYSMTCDGASHLSSLVDLAIGGMRFCVNAATGEGRDAVAEKIFPAVAKLMWSQDVAGTRHIGGYGFLSYPKDIRSPGYAAQYDALRHQLAKYASLA